MAAAGLRTTSSMMYMGWGASSALLRSGCEGHDDYEDDDDEEDGQTDGDADFLLQGEETDE